MTAERLLSVNEAAAMLGVSRRTFYRLRIAYVTVGKRRRYEPSELRLYLALHTTGRSLARAA